jgi:hypothetical protein
MANCSKNFKNGDDSYLSKITLSSTKEDQLVKSRNALREKIRSYLKDKGIKNPKFYRQGSFVHRTIIAPLDGDYDIDDGTYVDLTGFDSEPSTITIHNWIAEAVDGHTETSPKDKEACVRAIFKAGYHVDLPTYKIIIENDNEIYYLAKKKAGWEQSNPMAITNWFQDKIKKNSEQVRRLIKYFKGWKDYRKTKSSIKLPSGLTLTILCCEEYQSDIRDDISFCETARAVLNRLKVNDEIWKPYNPTENLRRYLTDPQFDNFLKELENLISKGDKAIGEESLKKSSESWREALGDRFPIIEDPDDNQSKGKKFEKPAIIGTTVRSA